MVCSFSGNTSKQLSRSIGSPLQPFAAVFVGENELAKGKLTVKVDLQNIYVLKLCLFFLGIGYV